MVSELLGGFYCLTSYSLKSSQHHSLQSPETQMSASEADLNPDHKPGAEYV